MLTFCFILGIFDGCFITMLGPIAFDLCGGDGAGQAIGFLLALCSIPLTIGKQAISKGCPRKNVVNVCFCEGFQNDKRTFFLRYLVHLRFKYFQYVLIALGIKPKICFIFRATCSRIHLRSCWQLHPCIPGSWCSTNCWSTCNVLYQMHQNQTR